MRCTQTDGVSRRANYRRLFDTGIDLNLIAEIRTATNGNYALGNDRFKAEVSLMLQRRVTLGKAGRPAKPDVGPDATRNIRRNAAAPYCALRDLALRRLAALDAADSLNDLSALRSIGLHKLPRDRAGQWAITVSGRWRICFRFRGGNAYDVEIVDYHRG